MANFSNAKQQLLLHQISSYSICETTEEYASDIESVTLLF